MPLSFHQQARATPPKPASRPSSRRATTASGRCTTPSSAHREGDVDGLEPDAASTGYAKDPRPRHDQVRPYGQHLDTGKHAGIVDADAKAAQAAGLSGTPAFLVGRGPAIGTWTAYLVSGAQPLAKFRKARRPGARRRVASVTAGAPLASARPAARAERGVGVRAPAADRRRRRRGLHLDRPEADAVGRRRRRHPLRLRSLGRVQPPHRGSLLPRGALGGARLERQDRSTTARR